MLERSEIFDLRTLTYEVCLKSELQLENVQRPRKNQITTCAPSLICVVKLSLLLRDAAFVHSLGDVNLNVGWCGVPSLVSGGAASISDVHMCLPFSGGAAPTNSLWAVRLSPPFFAWCSTPSLLPPSSFRAVLFFLSPSFTLSVVSAYLHAGRCSVSLLPLGRARPPFLSGGLPFLLWVFVSLSLGGVGSLHCVCVAVCLERKDVWFPLPLIIHLQGRLITQRKRENRTTHKGR